MSSTAIAEPYRRQPIRRTCQAIGKALRWVDSWSGRPGIKPFVVAFIGASVVLTLSAHAIAPWYELIINRSDSLPGRVFILNKTRVPECGNITALQMPIDARFFRGQRLIKIIKGCPGDVISRKDRALFVNQQPVGRARTHSTVGHHELFVTTQERIPEGKVYLMATHDKSYDSRYASFGLRDQSELLGTVYRVF